MTLTPPFWYRPRRMNTTAEMVRIKEALAWVDAPRCVQLKAVTAKGMPVELDAAQTRKLAERLLKLAATLETLQAEPVDGD